MKWAKGIAITGVTIFKLEREIMKEFRKMLRIRIHNNRKRHRSRRPRRKSNHSTIIINQKKKKFVVNKTWANWWKLAKITRRGDCKNCWIEITCHFMKIDFRNATNVINTHRKMGKIHLTNNEEIPAITALTELTRICIFPGCSCQNEMWRNFFSLRYRTSRVYGN